MTSQDQCTEQLNKKCPHCGEDLGIPAEISGDLAMKSEFNPSKDDMGMCVKCNNFFLFNEELKPVAITKAQAEQRLPQAAKAARLWNHKRELAKRLSGVSGSLYDFWEEIFSGLQEARILHGEDLLTKAQRSEMFSLFNFGIAAMFGRLESLVSANAEDPIGTIMNEMQDLRARIQSGRF